MDAKRVGFWITEKKQQKLNFHKFQRMCKASRIDLVRIDLEKDLRDQGHFDAILHKAADFLAQTEQGNAEAKKAVQNLKSCEDVNADVVWLDPLPSVRMVSNRYLQSWLLRCIALDDFRFLDGVLTPKCAEVLSENAIGRLEQLQHSKLDFPVICKSINAYGFPDSHKMALVFTENGLMDVKIPFFVQSFIPHNAVLYKVYVIGSKHFVVTRPSLKNFQAEDKETLFFDSHELSKNGCSHPLSEEDSLAELTGTFDPPSEKCVRSAVKSIRISTGLSLFGIDMVVERDTNRCYVIDLNPFPSYDGVPDFLDHLLNLIKERLNIPFESISNKVSDSAKSGHSSTNEIPLIKLDSGIGSCTDSDISDCERHLKERHLTEGTAFDKPVYLGADPLADPFRPNWTRVKKFYGIPKPASTGTLAVHQPLHSRRHSPNSKEARKLSNN